LAGHAFASVLRVAGEEPGSQAVVCDECGGDAGLRLRIAEWRRPSEGAIAFRLWTATLYPVEIASRQNFGEGHPSAAAGKAASFDELMANGQFVPPVTAAQNIAYGQLARAIDKRGSAPFPIAEGDTYSRRDGTMYVFIMWEGHDKIKGLLTVRLYNLDNEHLNKADLAKPVKLGLNKEQRTSLDVATEYWGAGARFLSC
jgi:hypothetical protein